MSQQSFRNAMPPTRPQNAPFVVRPGVSYTYPIQYGSTKGMIPIGYGLFPWMFEGQLADDLEGSAILVWDPAQAKYTPYSLAQCPTDTWFTLTDAMGAPFPVQFYLRVHNGHPFLNAAWT